MLSRICIYGCPWNENIYKYMIVSVQYARICIFASFLLSFSNLLKGHKRLQASAAETKKKSKPVSDGWAIFEMLFFFEIFHSIFFSSRNIRTVHAVAACAPICPAMWLASTEQEMKTMKKEKKRASQSMLEQGYGKNNHFAWVCSILATCLVEHRTAAPEQTTRRAHTH